MNNSIPNIINLTIKYSLYFIEKALSVQTYSDFPLLYSRFEIKVPIFSITCSPIVVSPALYNRDSTQYMYVFNTTNVIWCIHLPKQMRTPLMPFDASICQNKWEHQQWNLMHPFGKTHENTTNAIWRIHLAKQMKTPLMPFDASIWQNKWKHHKCHLTHPFGKNKWKHH